MLFASPETGRIKIEFQPGAEDAAEDLERVEYRKEHGVNVAIEIPDDIGRVLAGQAGDLSRAVLEATVQSLSTDASTRPCGRQVGPRRGRFGPAISPAPARPACRARS